MALKEPLHEPVESAEAELRELGSRFFGFALPASSLQAVEAQLADLHKQYPDATHICYAYRLGIEGLEQRAADSGEPKYSAGQPILNQIKSAGMTNVLAAVVRYYGGTKLGVPGLVRAYGGAAAEALANVPTQLALEAFAHRVTAAPSKAGLVYDTARKQGAEAVLLEVLDDGGQIIEVRGKGDATALLALLKARLDG